MKRKFNNARAEERQDVYERITARIGAHLENDVRPWPQPWKSGEGGFRRPLRHYGIPYRGINVLMLWAASMECGFESRTWMTFKQSQELGAHVRKGENSEGLIPSGPFCERKQMP